MSAARFIVTYLLTLCLGVVVAFSIALFVGGFLPSWKMPMFLVLTAWWILGGWWWYAKDRDRGLF